MADKDSSRFGHGRVKLMGRILQQNIVRESSFSYDEKGGTRVVKYLVTDLDPNGDPPVEAAFTPGAPYIYMPYPFFATNMYCTKVRVDPFGNSRESVWLVATFKSPTVDLSNGYQVKINGTVITKPFTADPQTISPGLPLGQPFQVGYQDPKTRVNLAPQLITFDIYTVHTVLEFTRIEQGIPVDLGPPNGFPGQLNSTPWQAGRPYTWLMKPPNAELLNQKLWRVSRSFEYAPESWNQIEAWKNLTGPNPIPSDVLFDPLQFSNGASIPKKVARYGLQVFTPPSSDFNTLDLPQIFG